MIKSTVAYLRRDHKWLMLLRNKKSHDVNKNKWIGVGGKFEENESSLECVKREVFEETGYELIDPVLNGIIYFYYDTLEPEEIHVYTCSQFTGNEQVCNEGTLAWIEEDKILDLNLWEGDKVFLKKLLVHDNKQFFIRLFYDDNGNLKKIEEI